MKCILTLIAIILLLIAIAPVTIHTIAPYINEQTIHKVFNISIDKEY